MTDMIDMTEGSTPAARDARAKAEIAIAQILSSLAAATGLKIGRVDVDMQNFATADVEIWFSEPASNPFQRRITRRT